jgi:L-ascorbate metabolism protein UlaG (beta-lactamase superfamily)
MGPEDAAIAAEWLGVKSVVPMHYGTFPELTGTPEELRTFAAPRGIRVVELRPGETV